MGSRPQYEAFVISAPGLERLVVDELNALGCDHARAVEGGVTFAASRRALYEANVHLRTASRVVVRAAEFDAKAFHELERGAAKLPWETFISPSRPVSLRVTCRKSRLYHSDAVAERVAGAIMSRVTGVHVAPAESDDPSQLILVRMLHDRCSISVDSSGPLLHLRGYRQALAKAPLRETLAAAALLATAWRGDTPLIDPMCGSGTIPIEGALIARRIAPGLGRHFAFESWPDFDSRLWYDVVAGARARVIARAPAPIMGSDRDAGAIHAAVSNADRAGVLGDVQFSERPISAIQPSATPGFIVSNPPYGVRVGERERLRNLYAQLGNVLRVKCRGWRFALLSADPQLERQLRFRLEPILRTSNGGIDVRVVAGEVTAGLGADPALDPTDTAAAQRYPS
jgi:putative N6-adenine-specific DNA methylase